MRRTHVTSTNQNTHTATSRRNITMYGWTKLQPFASAVSHRRCHHTLSFCQMLTHSRNSFTIGLGSKIATKSSTLQIPPHLKCVVTLPCEMYGTFFTNSDHWTVFWSTLYFTFLHSATSSSSASFGSKSSTNRTLILVDRNVIARSRICSSPCRICEKMPVSAPNTPKMSVAHNS